MFSYSLLTPSNVFGLACEVPCSSRAALISLLLHPFTLCTTEKKLLLATKLDSAVDWVWFILPTSPSHPKTQARQLDCLCLLRIHDTTALKSSSLMSSESEWMYQNQNDVSMAIVTYWKKIKPGAWHKLQLQETTKPAPGSASTGMLWSQLGEGFWLGNTAWSKRHWLQAGKHASLRKIVFTVDVICQCPSSLTGLCLFLKSRGKFTSCYATSLLTLAAYVTQSSTGSLLIPHTSDVLGENSSPLSEIATSQRGSQLEGAGFIIRECKFERKYVTVRSMCVQTRDRSETVWKGTLSKCEKVIKIEGFHSECLRWWQVNARLQQKACVWRGSMLYGNLLSRHKIEEDSTCKTV